jgi:SAM-dependent methyltransferase
MNWFEDWFNSPYYKILYSHRGNEEANAFVEKLISYLKLPANSFIADIPCGNGRHSIALAEKGFDVTGFDLADENVNEALAYEKSNLHFYKHDMRLPFHIQYFDYVFNLFTSLGYFENDRQDQSVINNFYKALKTNGILVVDFMNISCVLKGMNKKNYIDRNGVRFEIDKTYDGKTIFKTISIFDLELKGTYQEKVRAYSKSELETMIKKAGFNIIDTFGDYKLSSFNEKDSDRVIIIAKK